MAFLTFPYLPGYSCGGKCSWRETFLIDAKKNRTGHFSALNSLGALAQGHFFVAGGTGLCITSRLVMRRLHALDEKRSY